MSKKYTLDKEFVTRAELVPSTFSEEKNTIDVVFSTGARGLRQSFFDGPFFEELSLDPKHVRLERFTSGRAPVLNSHSQNSLSDILGVIDSARIEDGQGIATIRFSEREDVQPIIRDIRAGIISNVSVGYKIHRMENVGTEDGDIPVLRATDWEPMEASFVAVPFDSAANARASEETYVCEIITNENQGVNTMTDKKTTETEVKKTEVETRAVEVVAPKIDVEAERAEAAKLAVAEDRKRSAAITSQCEKCGIDDQDFIRSMTDGDVSMDKANAMILERISSESKKGETETSHSGIEVGEDLGRNARIKGMTSAILHRGNSAANELCDEGRAFRYMSLKDMAAECVRGNNIDTRGMAPDEIVKRAFHSTSDFPILLQDAVNVSLREGYEQTPRTYAPFVRQRPMADFKTHHSVQKGPAPQLELLGESGEITKGTMTEGEETYALDSYAKAIAITRKTIINDSLNALTSIPRDFGSNISDLENNLFWNLITTPQTMADGNALFHATHNNLGAAGGLSITTLSNARQLMREHTDLDGLKKINVNAAYLVVAPSDETAAEQLVTVAQGGVHSPDAIANKNPFSGKLQLIVEPRLNVGGTQAHYVMSAASMMPMAEWGVLQGQEAGPISSSYVDNDTKGVTFDILYDVVFHVVEYRGFVQNPG